MEHGVAKIATELQQDTNEARTPPYHKPEQAREDREVGRGYV